MGAVAELRRQLKQIIAGGIALMVVPGALTGCVSGAPDDAGTPTPVVPRASGDPVVLEEPTSIDGAEDWETDGIVVSVPAGADTERTEPSEGMTQIVVSMGDDADTVGVVIDATAGKVADADVDLSTTYLKGELSRMGAVDVTATPATWGQWPYANAIRYGAETEDGVKEALHLISRDEAGTFTIQAVASAPDGRWDESWQREVLASIRQAG